MEYIDGYLVSGFPRYTGESADEAIAHDLIGQDALWNAFQITVVSEKRISVELRMVCDRDNRTVAIYLLCACLTGGRPSADDLALVQQLLPKQYLWSRLNAMELAQVVTPSAGADETWRMARIHRRMLYMDLPFLQANEGAPGGTPGAAAATFQLDPLSADVARKLPTDPYAFQAELGLMRFCLPLLGEFGEFPSDRRGLFEAMQACAPAIVSFALHPFPAGALERDRQVATRLRVPLDFVGHRLAVSGFADINAMRRVYERYFLPERHIGVMTARVAARESGDAVAVAHQACTWLGGMRAFRVLTPQVGFPGEELGRMLANPELEYPLDDEPAHWTRARQRLQRDLESEGISHGMRATTSTSQRVGGYDEDVDWDPRYESFLIRVPHVYPLEEAAKMMRLPYGLDGGLPGLDTRMLPPFYPTAQRYDPIRVKDGPYNQPPEGRIRIGRVNPSSAVPAVPSSDEGLHWHSIPVEDLCKHALIVGSTGSGKTVTTSFLVRELLRLAIPFLVIEPVKTEYFDNLSRLPELHEAGGLKRWRFEGTPEGRAGSDFLYFDPMRLQTGVSVARHVSYLKSCFEAAFPMEAWQALFIENALLDYYRSDPAAGGCGLTLFTRGSPATIAVRDGRVYPSFHSFKDYFINIFIERELSRPDPSRAGVRVTASTDRMEEFRQVFRRRFENLGNGPLGVSFTRADLGTKVEFRNRAEGKTTALPRSAHFDYLLHSPTVVELDAVPDGDHKALIMAFLMTFLFERRQVDDMLQREGRLPRPREDQKVAHVLVVEEAHRLLASPGNTQRGDNVGLDSKAKAVALFVDMLAEIRALRQSLVIVEQIPTKLVPEAVKNTNLKIMLRMTARDDRDYLGEAMSFNEEQKQFVSTLRAEKGNQVQFVAFDENVDQPVLLSLPLVRHDNAGLFDQYFGSKP